MSFEGIWNDLHRAKLEKDERFDLFTQMQTLNQEIESNAQTIFNILDDPVHKHILTKFIGQSIKQINIHNHTVVGNTAGNSNGQVMLRKLPDPVKSYPITHSSIGAGSFLFPQTDGKFGGRCDLNGVKYIRMNDQARLKPVDEIGISLWIYPANLAGVQSIVEKAGQYQLRIENGLLEWNVFDSGGIQAVLTRALIAGVWTHIAATYDTVNGKTLWTGKVASTDSESSNMVTNTNDCGIFANGVGSNQMPTNTRMAQLSLLHNELTQGFVDDHFEGLLNTKNFVEITTVPFTGDELPRSNSTLGIAIVT